MKGHPILYSAEEMAWLEANRLMMISDYARAFCETFGRDVAVRNLHALRKRKGWKTGRTGCFEKGNEPFNKGKPFPVAATHPNCRKAHYGKGHEPHNTRYLGHERVSKDGYVEISIAETNPHTGYGRRYVLKHRWLWEQANGPVPKGHALKCLDGNRQNCEPDNWLAVSRTMLPRLAGKAGRYKRVLAYDDASPELKPTILAIAQLANVKRQRAKREAPRRNEDCGSVHEHAGRRHRPMNAYTLEQRRADTLKHIEFMASLNLLDRISPGQLATTYHGMTEAQVEAAMVRHLPEECAK